LSDPINVAIIDELWARQTVPAGVLAASVQRRIKVSRPAISTHITQLEERFVVERYADGTVGLTDREPIALIIQTAREFSRQFHEQVARDERAAHYLAERRLGKLRRAVAADIIEPAMQTADSTPRANVSSPGPTANTVAGTSEPRGDTGMLVEARPSAATTPTGDRRTPSPDPGAAAWATTRDGRPLIGVSGELLPNPPIDPEYEEAVRVASAGFPFPPLCAITGRPRDHPPALSRRTSSRNEGAGTRVNDSSDGGPA